MKTSNPLAKKDRRLFDFFTDHLKKNLPSTRSMEEAFDKTNDDLGFTAYSSLRSYREIKRQKRKG